MKAFPKTDGVDENSILKNISHITIAVKKEIKRICKKMKVLIFHTSQLRSKRKSKEYVRKWSFFSESPPNMQIEYARGLVVGKAF